MSRIRTRPGSRDCAGPGLSSRGRHRAWAHGTTRLLPEFLSDGSSRSETRTFTMNAYGIQGANMNPFIDSRSASRCLACGLRLNLKGFVRHLLTMVIVATFAELPNRAIRGLSFLSIPLFRGGSDCLRRRLSAFRGIDRVLRLESRPECFGLVE